MNKYIIYRLEKSRESFEDAKLLAEIKGGILVSTAYTIHVITPYPH